MNLDRTQMLQALSLAVMACFVAGGMVAARWRRPMRWAAVGLYGLALVLALVEVAVWLLGIQG